MNFFPYGPTVNNKIFPSNDDESTDALPLPRLFTYFNTNHRQIYLPNNGLFSFLGPISQFNPGPIDFLLLVFGLISIAKVIFHQVI
jgi:hypothetical protein